MARCAILVCAVVLSSLALKAQEPAPAPQPPTVAISVEATGESVPVIFFNRSIVVLRASIMGRSPDERRNLAVRMMDDLVERGETGPVTVTTTEGGVLIAVGRRVISGLTEADLDPVAGEDLQTAAREAAARMQLALTEAAEARRPGVWLRGGALSLLAILVSAVILWLLGRTRRATVARLSALAGRDGFSVCARQRYGRVSRHQRRARPDGDTRIEWPGEPGDERAGGHLFPRPAPR